MAVGCSLCSALDSGCLVMIHFQMRPGLSEFLSWEALTLLAGGRGRVLALVTDMRLNPQALRFCSWKGCHYQWHRQDRRGGHC